MGFMNILHNGYTGKLGETVGQKWKGDLTLRTYQAHNNSKSEAQLEQRGKYLQLIQNSSLFYGSSYNIIVPKNKRMNKFNYYTSILPDIMANVGDRNPPYKIGEYKNNNVAYPYTFTYNGDIYAYIFLNEGKPPKNADKLDVSIIVNFDSGGNLKSITDNFFTGDIIPKKIKPGIINNLYWPGFLAKTSINPNGRDLTVLSIGNTIKGMKKWTPLSIPIVAGNIIEDFLEDWD